MSELQTAAAELQTVITRLRRGLIDRPTPEGPPHPDLAAAISPASDTYFGGLQSLAPGTPELPLDLLNQAVEKMVEGCHLLWERPFPPGLEMGQILYAAILERPMRDLLRVLEEEGGSLVASDRQQRTLAIEAGEELARFNAWFDGLPARQRLGLSPARGCGLGALAVSFLLGWWVGGE
jgi:hypothetical protein